MCVSVCVCVPHGRYVNECMCLFQRCACTTAANTTRVRRGRLAVTWSVSVMTLELVSTPARASEAAPTTPIIVTVFPVPLKADRLCFLTECCPD